MASSRYPLRYKIKQYTMFALNNKEKSSRFLEHYLDNASQKCITAKKEKENWSSQRQPKQTGVPE